MVTPPVLPPPLPAPARRAAIPSTSLKLLAIGVLVALLWGALQLIDGVRRERLVFREQTRAGIAAVWGGEQFVAGPVLAVPVEGGPAGVHTEYFLPAELEIEGEMLPQKLQRGIFEMPVYEAKLRLHGKFAAPAAVATHEGAKLDWTRARVLLPLGETTTLRAAPLGMWNGAALAFEPANAEGGLGELLAAAVPAVIENAPANAGGGFAIELSLRGSKQLALALNGVRSRAQLRSSWADPSFAGGLLPVERAVSAAGFDARWECAAFGRKLPRQWNNLTASNVAPRAALAADALQVGLLQPVDGYRLVERAIKYGLLFVVLVFAVFFLFEATAALRIHPLQYLMVGAAVVLFFLGYLALGEFVASGLAYATAAAASTALVTGYSASVLRSGTRCATVGLGLGATYGYLYFILQLEDYSLLAGTAALFALLAVAMWATRRIDWYGRDEAAARAS